MNTDVLPTAISLTKTARQRPPLSSAAPGSEASRPVGSGQNGKVRVVVLFGGRSGEHSISIVTAAGVLSAIDPEKYEAIPIGITKHGQWVIPHAELLTAGLDAASLPEVMAETDGEVMLSLLDANQALQEVFPDQVPAALGKVDVVFPVLHGPFGEDGTLQGLLELADIPYVGCGVIASAVGMDKHYMKVLFAAAGLNVGPYVVVPARDWAHHREHVMARVSELKFPVYVKPARAGSSIGITRITDISQLEAAVAAAQVHDPKVIIEQGISGREVECAVLGGRAGGPPRASVIGEIKVGGTGFYDFESKYRGAGEVVLQIPADLAVDVAERIREISVKAFEALECEGLARVDVFVDDDGAVTVNEINTMPGFTPISMYPQLWAASGLAYADLIDELIQLALERPTGLR